jgi:hypothetical protein
VAELIYKTERWLIEQDPTMAARPDLVRFVKRSAMRKLLDQTARWTGDGWDPQRWVPRVPIVPQDVLQLVEQRMRGVAA